MPKININQLIKFNCSFVFSFRNKFSYDIMLRRRPRSITLKDSLLAHVEQMMRECNDETFECVEDKNEVLRELNELITVVNNVKIEQREVINIKDSDDEEGSMEFVNLDSVTSFDQLKAIAQQQQVANAEVEKLRTISEAENKRLRQDNETKERERLEQERLAEERLREHDRLRREKERQELESARLREDNERKERERLEQVRLAEERLREQDRLRREMERQEVESARLREDNERKEREKLEHERLAAMLREENERKEKEKQIEALRAERAEQERERAEQDKQRAEQDKQRAEENQCRAEQRKRQIEEQMRLDREEEERKVRVANEKRRETERRKGIVTEHLREFVPYFKIGGYHEYQLKEMPDVWIYTLKRDVEYFWGRFREGQNPEIHPRDLPEYLDKDWTVKPTVTIINNFLI